MKRVKYIILVTLCVGIFAGCSKKGKTQDVVTNNNDNKKVEQTTEAPKEDERINLINPVGTTIETRIKVPEGYTRTELEKGSFESFVRNYPLKPDGSKVLLYNGLPKGNQNAHVAVLNLPIERYDLQQCADSIMRIYAEYYYRTKQYDKISFHFTSGFEAKFSKWMKGFNIFVIGNGANYIRDRACNGTYKSFTQFLKVVFTYAGTSSMEKESSEIELKDIKIGDVFINGGSPGHVVMVVDVCTNKEGKKAFLLAQGYMPAQQFHILKNNNSNDNVWYYEEDITYPFSTPEYTFNEGSLRRLNY